MIVASKLDIKGLTFGRLTALSYTTGSRKAKGKWLCLCECGEKREVSTNNLTSGKTKSCGCITRELTTKRNTKHGKRYTREHRAWCAMKNRCNNENATGYENYGGRGIKVCERWDKSFLDFFDDMGEMPSGDLTLERINPDCDYTPDNCKWATKYEQARNKRMFRNNKSGFKGVCYSEQTRSWIAYWNDDTGKQKRRSFSSNKYGMQTAKNLAVKERITQLNKLNKIGIKHGKHQKS